jgi:hypothetical protein
MSDIADMLQRAWGDLLARPAGPMGFRFLVQPAVAVALAIRDGVRDAGAGRSPYFRTVLLNPEKRSGRLREGLAATAKVMLVAVLLDAVYQIIKVGAFYPGEAIVVAFALGFVPYLLIRGPADRIARFRLGKSNSLIGRR